MPHLWVCSGQNFDFGVIVSCRAGLYEALKGTITAMNTTELTSVQSKLEGLIKKYV
eukprot:SAG31_NODE_804_length_11973_cov_8.406855_1_plen_55_part_10